MPIVNAITESMFYDIKRKFSKWSGTKIEFCRMVGISITTLRKILRHETYEEFDAETALKRKASDVDPKVEQPEELGTVSQEAHEIDYDKLESVIEQALYHGLVTLCNRNYKAISGLIETAMKNALK